MTISDPLNVLFPPYIPRPLGGGGPGCLKMQGQLGQRDLTRPEILVSGTSDRGFKSHPPHRYSHRILLRNGIARPKEHYETASLKLANQPGLSWASIDRQIDRKLVLRCNLMRRRRKAV